MASSLSSLVGKGLWTAQATLSSRRADNVVLVRRAGVATQSVRRRSANKKRPACAGPTPTKNPNYNSVSHTPPAMVSGQPNSRIRQSGEAWRNSMNPSVISQALPSANARMPPTSARLAPRLPSATVPTDSSTSPSQQISNVFVAVTSSSSTQQVDQRKQQHPHQIDHVPVQRPGFQPVARSARRVGADPAAVGHEAENHHAQQHVQEVKAGEQPVQGEEGVVFQAVAQPRQVPVFLQLEH